MLRRVINSSKVKKITNIIRRVFLKEDVVTIPSEPPSEILPFSQPEADAVKLNIGGGKAHPKKEGWLVVDLRKSSADICIDITKEKLPFDDNSVDVIFNSHLLEHIYPHKLNFILSEFHRVLKPKDGLLRISVPDIRKAVEAYLRNDDLFFMKSDISQFNSSAPIGGLLASWFYSTRIFENPNLPYGEGHVHCFDDKYLGWWLKKAGFRHIWRSEYKGSILKELRDGGLDLHKHDSLFMEAVK